MLLGPTPAKFTFAPKHKASAYAKSEIEMSHEAFVGGEQENG